MAKRLYELSKEYGVANKDLLDFFKKHGFTLTSIGVVPAEALAIAEKQFKKGETSASVSEKKVEASISPKTITKEPVIANKATVEIKKESSAQTIEPKAHPINTPPKPATPSTAAAPKKVEHKEPFRSASHSTKAPVEDVGPAEILLTSMSIQDLAQKAKKPISEVIITLLKQGIVASKNQLIPEKVVASLAQLYGLKIISKTPASAKPDTTVAVKEEGVWKERLPVVVVIGHVDHGKTTLLDFIRKTRVAAKEKGGITQHLGAYEVKTSQGNIVFLDTPGHEAFSLMRARGIKVADIAILVIAADDGIMPQTLEAIKRAKEAQIPLIVAINKVDKATAGQIETVKRQLAQYDLTPEDWGGATPALPISAKLGQGIDELLDVVVLQSQLMELKANMSVPARGFVLESKIEKGRGPVATILCQHGTLKVGDSFIAGEASGKISSIVNSDGERLKEVGPSIPALIAGFDQLPQAGDPFEVVPVGSVKKALAAAQARPELFAQKTSSDASQIKIIVKADNASSREALVNSIEKLKSDHRTALIIYAGVGDVIESDAMLAADTGSIIYGFHVKVQPNALPLIQKKGIIIKNFDIIYKLLEELAEVLESGKPVKMVSKKIGEASVLKVFDIKNLGVIAGSIVKTGRFVRDGNVIIWRGKQKIGEGPIKGLQRERKAVKEVHAGFECGFLVEGFDTWEVDDRVECFQEVPAS